MTQGQVKAVMIEVDVQIAPPPVHPCVWVQYAIAASSHGRCTQIHPNVMESVSEWIWIVWKWWIERKWRGRTIPVARTAPFFCPPHPPFTKCKKICSHKHNTVYDVYKYGWNRVVMTFRAVCCIWKPASRLRCVIVNVWKVVLFISNNKKSLPFVYLSVNNVWLRVRDLTLTVLWHMSQMCFCDNKYVWTDNRTETWGAALFWLQLYCYNSDAETLEECNFPFLQKLSLRRWYIVFESKQVGLTAANFTNTVEHKRLENQTEEAEAVILPNSLQTVFPALFYFKRRHNVAFYPRTCFIDAT